MKILATYNLYYYGTSEFNCSYYFFSEPMLVLGHTVWTVDFKELNRIGGSLLIARVIYTYLVKTRPDMLFVVPCGREMPIWFLWIIKKFFSTTTISWNSDDDRRWNTYSKKYAAVYDAMITTYPHILDQSRKEGYTNIYLNQWGCNQRFQKKIDVNKKYDIAFVGTLYADRLEMIQALKDAGLKVAIAGKGWSKHIQDALESISQEDINLLYNQSRLVLVLSKGFETGVPQLKARVFESPATGTCTLIEENPYVRTYFEDGKEVILFDGKDDLIRKAKDLIADDLKRESIAKAGLARSHTQHSCDGRMKKMFADITIKKHKSLFTHFVGRLLFIIIYHVLFVFRYIKMVAKLILRRH